jgi:hypothetical protein
VLSPRTPFVVLVQDNTSLYSSFGYNLQCTKTTPLTYLILYTNADRSGLLLNSWNCSSGLVNHTAQIGKYANPNRKYLGLAAHDDGKVYVQYNQGLGPEMEEWQAPRTAFEEWSMTGKINMNKTS